MNTVGRRDESRISRTPVLVRMRWVLSELPDESLALRDNFGRWRELRDGSAHQHPGVDIEAPRGTRIFASRAGTVLDSSAGGEPNRTMGHFVKWSDDDAPGLVHYVMHMERAPGFPEGSHVAPGQTLGSIGTTGRSDGPHLHYGMELNGRMVDPYPSLMMALERSRQGVEGWVGDVPPTPEQNTAWWLERNEEASRLFERANAFQWPAVITDNAPDPSENRLMLRRIREVWQATMRTWFEAYRQYRARGDRAHALEVVRAMEASDRTFQSRVFALERMFSRTNIENVSNGVSASADAAAEVLQGLGSAATGFGVGAGVAVVVLLVMMAKRK